MNITQLINDFINSINFNEYHIRSFNKVDEQVCWMGNMSAYGLALALAASDNGFVYFRREK